MKLIQYSPRWDIQSIPDDVLLSEAARRNGKKGGRKTIDDPETEDQRKRRREYMRGYRETRKRLQK